MEQVYDKLRRQNVPLTPEERVRQWFISVLEKECHVPISLMNSETAFTLGEKKYRADILVWDKAARPVAVVECKRPDVKLSLTVADQALRYDLALGGLKWIFLTNGVSTMVLHKEADKYVPYNKLPSYEQMLEL